MSELVFMSVVAQHQNLGDVWIRRNALWSIRPDARRVVLAARMPTDYLDALEMRPQDWTITNPLLFQVVMLLGALTGRAHLILAPGPVALDRTLLDHAKAWTVLVNTALIRLRGGDVLSIGRSYRGRSLVGRCTERLQARVSTVHTVRDAESQVLLDGRSARVPDAAFLSEPRTGEDERTLIAVSVRGCRPESEELLRRLVDLGSGCGLRVVLVTQVHFDENHHDELASRLGVEHLRWGSTSHAQQLEQVDHLYGQAAFVVSNRLHGLLRGARTGAVPVMVDGERHPKLEQTLSGLVDLLSLEALVQDLEPALSRSRQQRVQLASDWNAARQSLTASLETPREHRRQYPKSL